MAEQNIPHNEHHTEHEEAEKSRRGLLFRLSKGILITVLSVIFAIAFTVLLIIEVKPVRQWALAIAEDEINSSLLGSVHLGDFELDWSEGLAITKVVVVAQTGDTVAIIPRLTLNVDVQALSREKISVGCITLINAKIRLIRGMDSVWNYERIAKPSEDTTSGKPFDWDIELGSLTLESCSVVRYDSTFVPPPFRTAFNFDRMRLEQLNCSVAGSANIAKKKFNVSVSGLSFAEIMSGFILNDISLLADVSPRGTHITGLTILTPRTDAVIEAHINDDIFQGFKPDSTHIAISINSEKFSGDDLCAFLPYANFTGTYDLDIETNGVLNDLAITSIDARTTSSALKAKGRLRNITRGDKLVFEAWLSKSTINYDEVRRNAIVLTLPQLDFIGTANISKGYVYGFPRDSLYFDFQPITVKSGGASGKLTLYMRDTLGYNADLNYTDLDLATIASSPSAKSSLNGNIKAKGKGFTLDDLTAEAELVSYRSTFAGRYYNRLEFKGGAYGGGVVRIDTLRLGIADSGVSDSIDVFANDTFSHLGCSGIFDLRVLKYPAYKLNTRFHNINLAYLTADTNMNLTLSGYAQTNAQGFHPDSLSGTMDAYISQFHLKDRSLMPFDLKANIKREPNDNRSISIRSTPITAVVKGQFSVLGLADRIVGNIKGVIGDIQSKTNSILGKPHQTPPVVKITTKEQKSLKDENPYRIPANVKFFINCRETSPIELFTHGVSLDLKGKVYGLIKGDMNSTDLIIDSLNIPSAHIKTHGTDVQTQKVQLAMRTRMNHLRDSSILDYASVSFTCDTVLTVNDLYFKFPKTSFVLRKDKAEFSVHGNVNDILSTDMTGYASIDDNALGFAFSGLRLGYGGREWQIRRDLLGSFSGEGLLLRQCELNRNSAESISISGRISGDKFNNFSARLTQFPLADLMGFPFMTPSVKELLKTLEGKVDTILVKADGDFTNPYMKVHGLIKGIAYNKVLIGDQTIDAESKDGIITGQTNIINPALVNKPKTFTVDINSLPFNIALSDIPNRWSKTKPLDISAIAKEFSLASIAPFIPGVTKVNGLGDAEISVKGIVGKEINYGGTVRFYKASFLTLSSNIVYRAAGKMTLRNNTVLIDTVVIANDVNDYPKGKASLTGSVLVDGFDIKYLDITIRSPELMVLSPASEATMPTMYGKFIIGSGKNPMRLRGTLDKPELTGDVIVRDADITMPPDKKFQKRISVFRYERDSVSGKQRYSVQNIPDTVKDTSLIIAKNEIKKEEAKINAGLVDKMKYDLNIIIVPNKFKLTMILGSFEKLIAFVNPKDRTIPLNFRREPFGPFQMFGELIVQDKSTYEFVKLLSAGGSLNFETGHLDNPRMNLTAVLKQKRTINNMQQPYSVTVTITGTKKEPIVTFSYQIDGIEGTGTKEEITESALMLLVFARTKHELFGSQTGQGSLVGDLSGSASSLITSQLGSLLQGTFISEANINFNGTVGDISNANVSLAGQIIGDVQWRVGGNIGDLSSNNSFSIDIPLSAFFDQRFLDNLVLQLTTSAVNNNASANALRQQKLWEVKVGWRYSF